MIGFCGSGNMASAIVSGLIAHGSDPAEIVVTDRDPRRVEKLTHTYGVQAADDNTDLVQRLGDDGTLILAVKPNVIPTVLEDLRPTLERYPVLVVSIAAGVTLSKLESLVPNGTPVIRVMPNVNVQVGAGMSAVCGNSVASEWHIETVVEIFDAVGEVAVLAEKDFSAFAALAGCSPAFVFDFIEAMARGGVADGLTKQQAVRFAAQAVLGSAALVLDRASSGQSPANLRDMVTSPGGTTIAGLIAMEDNGFSASVVRGVQAAIDRDRELGAPSH